METSDSSGRYASVFNHFLLYQQGNSVNHVQKKQRMTTTWPPVGVLAVPSARLTTRARKVSPQWTAVAVLKEPTWMRRASVCPAQVVLAMIKTPLLQLDRLSSEMAPHGNYLQIPRFSFRTYRVQNTTWIQRLIEWLWQRGFEWCDIVENSSFCSSFQFDTGISTILIWSRVTTVRATGHFFHAINSSDIIWIH